ncbi:MAG: hypothetical protein IJ966_00950 [Bacilli bacterium]|nr:hypothetical protein [Bacilli bacterium]
MSSIEYKDLFVKCQFNKDACYHVFCYDIVDSKNISSELNEYRFSFIKLAYKMRSVLEEMEKARNKRIVIDTSEFDERFLNNGVYKDPFILGDAFCITIYRGSISEEEVNFLFYDLVSEFGIPFEFHLANGYYETNDYCKGNKLLWRGYAVDILMNLHKEYYSDVRRLVKGKSEQ